MPDVADLASGAVVLSKSSEYGTGWASLLLLDDNPKSGWCSAANAEFPHEIVIELADPTKLQRIVFDNSENEESGNPGISARKIEVWGSVEGPEAGWKQLLEVEAAQGAESEHEASGNPVARWIKLVIRSNWGHEKYTELMEVSVYGTPESIPASERPPLAGVYDTSYNKMLFEQEGERVTGCYDWDGGVLTGTTDGRVVQFEWREDEGTQVGTAVMVLSAGGDVLNGIWYEKGKYRGLWLGTRSVDGKRPRCTPPGGGRLQQALDQGGRAILYGIRFDIDSATLRAESETALQEVLEVLKAQPDLKLAVEGHTDASGTAEHNLALSRRRAAAVVDWLVAHEVAAERLVSEGFGQAQPVASNDTAQGRALNRRVELKRR